MQSRWRGQVFRSTGAVLAAIYILTGFNEVVSAQVLVSEERDLRSRERLKEVVMTEEQSKQLVQGISFKQWIDFVKFFLGTFTVGVTTIVVNYQIQNRELELKELEKLGGYVDHALEENIGVRRRFSQYFATVTRSNSLRKRWEEYNLLVEQEYGKVVKDKEEKERLESQLQEAYSQGEEVGGELTRVRTQILLLEQELKVARERQRRERKITVQAYWHEEGFTAQDAEELRIKLENQGIPTVVLKHINPGPPDSIFIGALVSAKDARLVLSSLPYEVKYIFPITYPDIEGGDLEGLRIGVGYMSTHSQENRYKDNTPIRLTREQFDSLLVPNISNAEFQLRLRNIASPQ